MKKDNYFVEGVYTAMVTPFKQDGTLDIEGFIQNIHFQIENQVDGLVILGTTGEAPTLNHNEKRKLIQLAIQETQGNIPIMVGTGSYSTATTIETSIEAEELGADSVLIVTPYYNKPTQEGLYRHFKAIAESISIPMMVYNIAGRTGQNMSVDTLKRVADLPNIFGVKEASGSIPQMIEVMETIGNHRENFSVMCGDDLLTLPCMSIGGNGVISVVSNLVPDLIKKQVTAMQEGRLEEARKIHYHLVPLYRAAFIETNPIPIKTAMNICGMAAGPCRLPLCELSPNNLQALHEVLHLFERQPLEI